MSLIRKLASNRWVWALHGLPSLARAHTLFSARPYTMTSSQRCRDLWDVCHRVFARQVPGSLVECGVWRGGSAAIMGRAAQHAQERRHLHLFDSFEGLPEPDERDGEHAIAYSAGRRTGALTSISKCEASLEEVKKILLEKLGLPGELVTFHRGWFQHTVPIAAKALGPIAVLRLDGDWYESTAVCLEHLYPLLSHGGALILDDYSAWQGCRKATDEYRAAHGIHSTITRVDDSAVYWIKV
jgi:O-methyltransferase